MLNTATIEGTNIVTATYDGSLSAEEMDTLRSELRTVRDAHGTVRLLVEYGDIDLGRIEPEAFWKDLKTAGMLGDVERCAMVTDAGWLETLGKAADRLAPFEVRTFSADDRDDAVAWLS